MNLRLMYQYLSFSSIDGIRSFRVIRSRALRVTFRNHPLLVASLGDIIRSKSAAGRPQDLAVLPVLKETLREKGEAS